MSEEKRIGELETEMAVVKSNMTGLSSSIDKILYNHLPHIQDGIDKLGEKIDGKFNNLAESMERKYVSKVEFEPVKNLVYRVVIFVIIAVIGSVLGFVLVK